MGIGLRPTIEGRVEHRESCLVYTQTSLYMEFILSMRFMPWKRNSPAVILPYDFFISNQSAELQLFACFILILLIIVPHSLDTHLFVGGEKYYQIKIGDNFFQAFVLNRYLDFFIINTFISNTCLFFDVRIN